jgi:hypothetical protein
MPLGFQAGYVVHQPHIYPDRNSYLPCFTYSSSPANSTTHTTYTTSVQKNGITCMRDILAETRGHIVNMVGKMSIISFAVLLTYTTIVSHIMINSNYYISKRTEDLLRLENVFTR